MEPEVSLPHSQEPRSVPILSQIDTVHASLSHFFRIRFNYHPPTYAWVLQSALSITSPVPIRATCPAYLTLLVLITRTIFSEQYRSLSSPLCRFLHSPVTSSLSSPNIFLSTLFSNTLSLRASVNVSDQVSHPYKTEGKITVPCILIFIFLCSKLNTIYSATGDNKQCLTAVCS